ncbi:TonB-dependent receptor [Flammeovirgaceae bacterium SG7u.111]|nr:TonB-dependent receptor [Flammeovirgaceae bacterium SG7u.111]
MKTTNNVMANLLKRKMPRLLLTVLLSLVIVTSGWAQSTVSGKVTSAEDSEGIPGVSILIKGTSTGVVTDINGGFSIKVEPTDVLVFSYVGFVTQEVTVGNQSNIEVALVSDVQSLEEVVVIGYTTRKKGEVTGSVSTVGEEVIGNTPNRDLQKSMAGRVPGLIVVDRGGYPGESGNSDLLIRGQSTLNNNSPLILIDGLVAASFSHLAPQDIESLTVLKDGAAAIYGARAANGVILITTKRGKQGKARISLSSFYNISGFAKTPKLMNSAQFATYENEISERNGTPLRFTPDEIEKYAAGNDPLNYPSTDWADLTFRDYAPESRTSLSISGGSEKVSYFVSGDYLNQGGMYESGALGFEQYQVRSNLDMRLHKNFSLGVDLTGRFGERERPGVDEGYIYKHIYTNEPTEVGVYPNGLVAWGGENGSNPYIMSSNESGFVKINDNDLRGKFSYDWDLNTVTEGLSLRGYAGIRKMSNNQKAWYTPWTVYTYDEGTDEYIPSTGYSQSGNERILRETFWKFDELLLNTTVNYDRTFNDHTVRGLVGIEQFSSQEETFWAQRRGFPTKDHPYLFAGSDEGQQSYGTAQEWGRLNYFGSLSYDFKKKYFIDLTLRHDGSSNFGKGNQYGTFPGVAASWSIGNEAFMEGITWLDALKIRSSWALMGNDRIPGFQFLTRYEYGGETDVAQPNYYIFGTPGSRYNGYTPDNVPNPNITWEKADMKNIGVSFLMFNNRLYGDINYFYQKRTDILITRNASIPDAAGLTLPQENLGKVDNFGWELELTWNDKIGAVDYNVGFNFTNAQNKIVYMDEAADVPEWRKQEGHPMGSYIIYPTNGIFRDQAQVDATEVKKDGTVEGEPIYIDTNEDGEINADDRIRSYTSNIPQIQYGFHGGASYKGFDFSFLLQGQAKADMLVFFDQGGTKPEYVFNERWTPDNREARYPRAFATGDPYSGTQNTADNFQGADLWMHDASFIRLKEVQLAYTFPREKIKFADLKIFARGFNLLTMASEVSDLGLDPEIGNYNNFRDARYPSLRTYSFGFSLGF